jgi:hypothetical protein
MIRLFEIFQINEKYGEMKQRVNVLNIQKNHLPGARKGG